MFCPHCGAAVEEAWLNCGPCGKPLPRAESAHPLATQIGAEIKTSTRDAASALRALARDPVSGMVATWNGFGPTRAQAAGIALGVFFALAATIGMTTGMRRFFGGMLGFYGGGPATFVKIFFAMLVLPATVAVACFGIRRALRAREVFAADLFTAGTALAPLGLAVLASGLLGIANLEVIALFFLFALSYLVLMLHRGLVEIGKVNTAAGPPAVPAVIALSIWLTKIVVAALF